MIAKESKAGQENDSQFFYDEDKKAIEAITPIHDSHNQQANGGNLFNLVQIVASETKQAEESCVDAFELTEEKEEQPKCALLNMGSQDFKGSL